MFILKEATQLDDYPLRAAICEHLLEPIYINWDDAMSEDEVQVTIRLCSDFLNREIPSHFINRLGARKDTELATGKRRPRLRDMDSPEASIDSFLIHDPT